MNNELLNKEKRFLTPIRDVQEHHNNLLKQHLEPIGLNEQKEGSHIQTAFPTSNHFYKQKITKTVQNKKEQEILKKE